MTLSLASLGSCFLGGFFGWEFFFQMAQCQWPPTCVCWCPPLGGPLGGLLIPHEVPFTPNTLALSIVLPHSKYIKKKKKKKQFLNKEIKYVGGNYRLNVCVPLKNSC